MWNKTERNEKEVTDNRQHNGNDRKTQNKEQMQNKIDRKRLGS
jgi:hypothetical protein